jgi:DNA-binding GntR family transcriptional regulator
MPSEAADGFTPASTRLEHSSSLREQALALLRQRLVTGEIAPDRILSVAALASELGVSTSPVREAMLALVHEGVMEAVRNRGYRVVPVTDGDRREIHQLRVMLEPAAMRLLADNPEVLRDRYEQLVRLAKDTVECAKTGDLVGHLESDRQFHALLFGAIGNDRLTNTVMLLRDQTRRYTLRSVPLEALTDNAAEHVQLLDAILEGDAAQAESVMLSHLSHLDPDHT